MAPANRSDLSEIDPDSDTIIRFHMFYVRTGQYLSILFAKKKREDEFKIYGDGV